MDTTKNYVGKVVKIYYTSNNKEYSQTGVVFAQQSTQNNNLKLSMLLTNGQEWDPIPFTITKVSSTRIDEGLRNALTEYCKAKISHKAFLDKFWKEKSVHEDRVKSALNNVREFSGAISHNEFMDAVIGLLNKTFPSARHSEFHHNRYFSPNSIGNSEITISHVQEIEKYATPEKYPFIFREYDGCLFIESSHPSYKKFCDTHAPAELSALKGKAKTSVCANVGDKNFLTVSRTYTFPLKHGITKQSLEDIQTLLSGKQQAAVSPQSFQDKLNDAHSRSGKSTTGAKTKGYER